MASDGAFASGYRCPVVYTDSDDFPDSELDVSAVLWVYGMVTVLSATYGDSNCGEVLSL